MKRVILLTVALLFAATMAYAECSNCKGAKAKMNEGSVQEKAAKMTERLGLTQEQADEVKALITEKAEKKKAVMEECRAKKESIAEEYSAKIKALLTDDQKVKYDEWKAEKEEAVQERKAMKKEKMMKKGR
ncbi:MAG: hypothetical protein JW847_07530 [Candidatus Omnitrophica bacterium]|nr:hypothetical protein [Candidatus Omnitrophota bacterium]